MSSFEDASGKLGKIGGIWDELFRISLGLGVQAESIL